MTISVQTLPSLGSETKHLLLASQLCLSCLVSEDQGANAAEEDGRTAGPRKEAGGADMSPGSSGPPSRATDFAEQSGRQVLCRPV